MAPRRFSQLPKDIQDQLEAATHELQLQVKPVFDGYMPSATQILSIGTALKELSSFMCIIQEILDGKRQDASRDDIEAHVQVLARPKREWEKKIAKDEKSGPQTKSLAKTPSWRSFRDSSITRLPRVVCQCHAAIALTDTEGPFLGTYPEDLDASILPECVRDNLITTLIEHVQGFLEASRVLKGEAEVSERPLAASLRSLLRALRKVPFSGVSRVKSMGIDRKEPMISSSSLDRRSSL